MTAFPSSPVDGQTYSIGPRSWSYSDQQEAWVLNRGGPTGPTGAIGPIGPPGVLLTSLTVDTFLGNGVDTIFPLSVTPLSVYNMVVNVDGLVQTANTNYTIFGSNIIFSQAPIANATIDVMHLITGSPITGPTGPAGLEGPTGPRRGSTGPTGAAGSPGIVAVSVPGSSIGSPGDQQGLLAFNQFYFYYCSGPYDGITNVWRRVPWDGNTW